MKVFKFGFIFNGFTFGWYDKELWRLPSQIKNRYYTEKKLDKIQIGNKYGYRCGGKKFTVAQLKSITNQFSQPIIVNSVTDKDCPF